MNVPAVSPASSLIVSPDGSRLVRRDGQPFFWLGDTAWLANIRLTRQEMLAYLDNRAAKGYTVIQVMGVHTINGVNIYGRRALPFDVSTLLHIDTLDDTAGKAGDGYWETMDFLVGAAAERGIYAALVPVWGTVVQGDELPLEPARAYARLLALRYKNHPNIIWLNGGDLRGSDHREVWDAIGETLKANDPLHPVTFHPFGRTRSATWFHATGWLDFNMFQSGHRNYEQRDPDTEIIGDDLWRGEDNWRYVLDDLQLCPKKPTIDGEPSYEDIPHGLHDASLPLWNASDCRRYAYWALLAGAFGHTYGHNSIMQFHDDKDDKPGSYGAVRPWMDCLDDPGARQMSHVRAFMEMLGGSPLHHRPEVLRNNHGDRYRRILAAGKDNWIVAYTFTGETIAIEPLSNATGIAKASWFDPRTGMITETAEFNCREAQAFNPPTTGSEKDWLLLIQL